MATMRRRERGMSPLGYVLILLVLAAATVLALSFLDALTNPAPGPGRTRGPSPEGGEAHPSPEAIAAARVVELDETTADASVWGQNYPAQYEAYLRTVDIDRTRHGGSEAFQKLDADPLWRELFAGYPFGIDYREDRGHAYMLQDQRESERVTRVKQPGACLHCHASVVPAYRRLGLADGAPGTLADPLDSAAGRAQLVKGFELMSAMPYEEASRLVEHPVTCLDCHDPATMRLRVTRPAFLEGIVALAEGDAPVGPLPSIERWRQGERKSPYDANTLASREEMRTLVCAQCHTEYVLMGEGRRVTYPWGDGLTADAIESTYDTLDVTDWTHGVSRAPMLKAQHPEFELWSAGIHARSGVACADCHMPPTEPGVSNHQVRSPLFSIEVGCLQCHEENAEEMQARVYAIQDKTQELMLRAERATVSLLQGIREGMAAGLDDADLVQARDLHRRAQWRLDFVASENSMGFHAPQEAARLLGEAIDYARQGELAVMEAQKAVEPN